MSRPLSWVAVVFVAAAVPVALILSQVSGSLADGGIVETVFFVCALIVTTLLGWLIVRRHPGHRVGTLLLLSGCIIALSGLSAEYANYSLTREDPLPGGRLAATWDTTAWPLLFAPIVAIAWIFPDGRLVAARWRWPAVLGAAAFASCWLGGLLSDRRLDAPFEKMRALGIIAAPVSGVMQAVGLTGMFVTIVLGVACLTIRFRRSRGQERQQVKWIALAGVMIPFSIVVGTLDRGAPSTATGVALGLTLIIIPLAIGVAVLRHGLYDIDRLISATVLYAVLTILLAGAFVAITLLGGVVAGRGSPVTTAVATLVVTLAFRPLQLQLQRYVDRAFNRARYDALRVVDAFLDDLRAGRREPEALGQVLGSALGDPSLQLYFWLPGLDSHADSSGRLVKQLPGHPGSQTAVRRGTMLLATAVHEGIEESGHQLLGEVLGRAGLAIEVARLRVEVRRQLTEVEESRFRIVTAGKEERRRLERDLHDGAQQRLVSIGLDLRHLQRRVTDGRVSAGLNQAVDGLAAAIQELRALANGVRPNTLDAGLAAAFTGLAASAPLPTEVDATSQRFASDVEAAAYFVASEGLANAVKHAAASRVQLTATATAGLLTVAVSDDGRGGARAGEGSGLTGLQDRVAALGGSLSVVSPRGSGTRLEMEIPCA